MGKYYLFFFISLVMISSDLKAALSEGSIISLNQDQCWIKSLDQETYQVAHFAQNLSAFFTWSDLISSVDKSFPEFSLNGFDDIEQFGFYCSGGNLYASFVIHIKNTFYCGLLNWDGKKNELNYLGLHTNSQSFPCQAQKLGAFYLSQYTPDFLQDLELEKREAKIKNYKIFDDGRVLVELNSEDYILTKEKMDSYQKEAVVEPIFYYYPQGEGRLFFSKAKIP